MNANTLLPRNFETRSGLALLAGTALAALPLAWLARQPLAEALALVKDREAVLAMAQGLGAWGPFVLWLTIAAQVTFAVLPGHVLMLAGGYLYGFVPGFCITLAATVSASQLNYLLARRYGWPLVYRMAPRQLVDRWQGTVRGKGFFFILMTFVLPIFPSDLMSYLAGFSRLNPRRYFLANLLGHLPCALGMSLVGSGLLTLPASGWAWSLVLCVAALLLWKRYGKALEDRFFPGHEQEAQ
jgi:uncharacterized membrane protein YdjX (TVP38/TMEM64 family)